MDDGGIVSPIQKMAFRASRLPFLVEGKQFPHADDSQSIQSVVDWFNYKSISYIYIQPQPVVKVHKPN